MFLILNRFKLNTVIEELNSQVVVENNASFLIYKNENGDIRGFWFFDKAKKDQFYEIASEYVPFPLLRVLLLTSNFRIIAKDLPPSKKTPKRLQRMYVIPMS